MSLTSWATLAEHDGNAPAVTPAGGLLLGVAQSLIAGYGLGANQHEFGALAPMLAVMIVPAARATTLAEGVPE